MTLDFEGLFKIISTEDFNSYLKGGHPEHHALKSTFEIMHNSKSISTLADKNPLFLDLIKKMVKEFNAYDIKLDCSIFTSFVQGASGNAHVDKYDVLLYTLLGEVMYIVGDERYTLKQGDLLYIKQGEVHQSIGLTPRIVFSLGIRSDIKS